MATKMVDWDRGKAQCRWIGILDTCIYIFPCCRCRSTLRGFKMRGKSGAVWIYVVSHR